MAATKPSDRTYRKTPELRERIAELRQRGLTQDEIGETVGKARQTVAYHMRALGTFDYAKPIPRSLWLQGRKGKVKIQPDAPEAIVLPMAAAWQRYFASPSVETRREVLEALGRGGK